jgi:NAD+ synthase (glutamine-hydrolysing)
VAVLRIALAQLSANVGDVTANTDRVLAAWERAATLGSDLLLTPELALVGYPPDDLLLHPELHERLSAAEDRLASQGPSGTVAIVGTVGTADVEGRERWGVASAAGLTNRALVIEQGRMLGSYDKMRLPNEGVFDEARYFVPGTSPLVVDVAGVPVGTVVCQDLWAAEGPVLASVEAGARVVAVLNASPYHRGKRAEREAWVRHHAVTHGVWVAYVNRVGGQDEVVFDGTAWSPIRRGPSSRAARSSPRTSSSSISRSTSTTAIRWPTMRSHGTLAQRRREDRFPLPR